MLRRNEEEVGESDEGERGERRSDGGMRKDRKLMDRCQSLAPTKVQKNKLENW